MPAPFINRQTIAHLMTPEARKLHRIELPDETAARVQAGEEKEFQRESGEYLRSSWGIMFNFHDYSRGKNKPGAPDWMFPFMGFFIGIELKTEKGRLRKEQDECLEEILLQGGKVAVCSSIPQISAFMRSVQDGTYDPRYWATWPRVETETKGTR